MSDETQQTKHLQPRSGRTSFSSRDNQRTENEIVQELKQLAGKVEKSEGDKLVIHIQQGKCLQNAADVIKEAGGTEKWLAKHHVDLGIGGKSRTVAANLLSLAREGYDRCQDALVWAAENREHLRTTRTSGLDYFVIALRRYKNKDHLPTGPIAKRPSKPDREKTLLAVKAQWADWTRRLLEDLEKACVDGWNPRVLNAIRLEMQNADFVGTADDASGFVPPAEDCLAHAEHHSDSTTDSQVGEV